jgi:hypothetical protein
MNFSSAQNAFAPPQLEASNENPNGLGVAMGIDPLTDAIQTAQQLSATLASAAASGSPLDANALSIASAQIRNIGVDLSLAQTQFASLQNQIQAATGQPAIAPSPNADPNAVPPVTITPAAAGFIALGALAIGGLGAYLIFGRHGGAKRGGRHANPTDPPKRRRRRRAR